MRVRMFKPQFAPLILSGAKRQTIRPMPRRIPRVHDQESWRQWSGRPYHTQTIELVQVQLTMVKTIQIDQDGNSNFSIIVAGRELSHGDCAQLAGLDGFTSLPAMLEWFARHHTHSFIGLLLRAADIPVERLTHGTP